MRAIVPAAVASMIIGMVPVLAKEMHCNVNKDFKSAFDGMQFEEDGTTYKLRVKGTFDGVPASVSSSDYNGFVNVKFGTRKTTKKELNVRVRPRRSSECLNGIYNDSKKQLWGGAHCDTQIHKKASSVTLRAMDQDPKMYVAAGTATTTSKQNQFMAFYRKPSDAFVITGVCVEDR